MAFADPRENYDELVGRMPTPDQLLYRAHQSHRTTPCFNERIVVAYVAGPDGEPTEITHWKVLNLEGSAATGFLITMEEAGTGSRMHFGVQPARLPRTDIFLSLPVSVRLTSGVHIGTGLRSIAYGLRISMADDSRRTPGRHYLDTLNEFRRMFPETEIPNLTT